MKNFYPKSDPKLTLTLTLSLALGLGLGLIPGKTINAKNSKSNAKDKYRLKHPGKKSLKLV